MNAARPECRPATEEISGLIERVTFHNDESGFCVDGVRHVLYRLPELIAGQQWPPDAELLAHCFPQQLPSVPLCCLLGFSLLAFMSFLSLF
jgi:hypothetical protein